MQADLPQQKKTSTSQRLVIGMLLLGAVLMGFFGWRAYIHYGHLQEMEASGFTVESLRGWMTLPYMAERYDVPVEDLFVAVGVEVVGNDKRSLRQLIKKYQLDDAETRHAIEQVIAAGQNELSADEKPR